MIEIEEKQEKGNGGSSVFKMVQDTQEKPINAVTETEDISEDVSKEEAAREQINLESNAILIETTVKLIGKTAEMLTKMPEMNFDVDEVEQLKVLWASQIPGMSPMTAAIIGTAIIISGKVAIYMSLKKQQAKQTKEEK